jgi:ligand-binding sensor domain-containing protein
MNRAAFPHRIVWLSLALALLLAAVWPLAPRRPEAAALGPRTGSIIAPALYASVQSVAADRAGVLPQQPPEAPDGDDWVWRTFTSENSPLAPVGVNALLTDDQGRVWIGTDAGISVYQHGVWRTFTSDNSLLAPGSVRTLLADDRDRIWAGTNAGVSVHQDGVWQTFTSENSPLAAGPVGALMVGERGQVWVGTIDGIGIYQDGVWQTFTSENSPLASGYVSSLLADEQGRVWIGAWDGLSVYQDGVWQTFTSENSSLAPGGVMTLLMDEQDRFWVGTMGGFSVYKNGVWQTFTPETSPLVSDQINALLADEQGRVWVGTKSGVNIYQDGIWQTFTPKNSPLAFGWISTLLADKQGWVWVGTGGGVSIYQDGAWQTFTPENSPLGSYGIRALLADEQGRAWIGTGEGLSVYQNSAWQTFNSENSPLVSDTVWALLADDQGQIWVGTYGGLSIYQDGVWQVLEIKPPVQEAICALLVDNVGRVWSETGNKGRSFTKKIRQSHTYGGISVYYEGVWQTFSSENSPLASNQINASLIDEQGQIWVGTSDGLSVYQDGAWQTFNLENSLLTSNEINALLTDKQGRVWVGTSGGVNIYQDGAWQAFTSENSPLASDWVSALLTDEQGRIWIGTDDGLSVYQDGIWQTFTSENSPLVPGGVWAMLADEQGRIWVAAWDGFSVYQGDAWQTFTSENSPLVPQDVSVLQADKQGRVWVGTDDGLSVHQHGAWQTFSSQNSLLAPGDVNALQVDEKGWVWVGTYSGVSVYTPQNDPPWICFTGWSSRRSGWWAEEPLGGSPPDASLVREDNSISFSFIGADLESHPSNIRYRYQLRGRDEDWSVTADTTVTYENLPPGHYTFVVQAMDEDGMFSPEATLEITVPAYFYETRTFQILFLVGLLALIGGGEAGRRRWRRSRRLAALRRGEDPYVVGAVVEDPDKFYGRRETLDAILTALAHDNHVALYGERRIGKTSLLYQLSHRLRELSGKDKLYVPVFFSFQVAPEESSFFANLAHAVASAARPHTGPLTLRVESRPAGYAGQDLVNDLALILAKLREKGHEAARIVLLLDEGDIMNGYDPVTQGMLRGALMTPTGQRVLLVWSGQAIERTWRTWGSPWYNLFKDEIQLGGLEEAEARRLIVEPVKGLLRYDEEAMARILSYSQRIPYRIQRLCSACVRRLLAEERFQVTAADVDAVRHQVDAGDQARADQYGAAPLTYEMKTTSQPMAEEEAGYDPNDPQEVQ